jgi:hypothetical protein
VRDSGGEWQDVEETVRIVCIPCRFGGARPYFICPGVVNGITCGRRVAKLVTMPVRAIQVGRGRAPAPRQGDRCGGQLQAPKKLLQTGQVLAKAPDAMQLRYLGTLLNIAGKRSSTINFACADGFRPVSVDLD